MIIRQDDACNTVPFLIVLTGVLKVIDARRKRKRIAEFETIVAEDADLFGCRGFRVEGRLRNKKRQRMRFSDRYDNLTETEFQSRYKLDKDSFQGLVERLRPHLEKNETEAKRSSGEGISVEMRLSITIRWLCGGAHQDICDLHGVAKPSFFGIIHETVHAIIEVEHLPLDAERLLSDVEYLKARAREFEEITDGALKRAFGSVDGLLLKIIRPSSYDSGGPSKYWCHKGFYAIVCQAVADAERRFQYNM